MPLTIRNSSEPNFKPSVLMLIYGEGGVGKSTVGASAPKPLIVDCENGSKYFGLRGIKADVAVIDSWSQMKDVLETARTDKYETIVIDPIGELMDKLKRYMVALQDSKLVQRDGTPTMAGWGWLKKTLRDYIKVLRDSGKHVLLIAHVDEKQDEDRQLKRPMIETKVSKDIVNMVDIVGYMTVVQTPEGESKRVIIVDPGSDKYTAKDRTGQLGKIIPPDFSQIVEASQGTKDYAWSKPVNKEPVPAVDLKITDEDIEPIAKKTKDVLQDKIDKAMAMGSKK